MILIKNTNKAKIFSLILILIIISNPLSASASNVIDVSKVNQGIVSINYDSPQILAVIVQKNNIKKQYILNEYNKTIPLQLGNGNYTITALEHSKDNKFKVINRIDVDVELTNENLVYLQSINIINFNKDMEAMKKAEELTKEIKTDEKKIAIIYQYVIENVKYDSEKITTLTNNYLPDLNETYKTNKGICYDYASLTAGMLRYLGIPTKLVKGYTPSIKDYHAWNEVFINNEWKVIDTTHDAAYMGNNLSIPMYKNVIDYSNFTGKY